MEKNEKNKMPLVLYGARQVGKTYIVTEFGRENYNNMVYVNFEQDEKIIPYFEDSVSPEEIIKVLESFYNEKIIPIEVKSSENVKAKSLQSFIKQYSPEYSIRISSKNFGMENNIKSVPLYATFMI